MSRTPFILPEGLVLRQEDDGLVVEYDGDIELSTTLGGRIALLNSTGGDVILNAALEVGQIKSAGALRAQGDVRAERIEAGSVQVGGDLRATTIQSGGRVSCGGDLDAEELRASSVQSSALRVGTLEASGEVETTGQTRLGRGRASALRAGGDLEADELTLSGELASVGGAQVGVLAADTASIGGDLKIGRAELAGSLHTGGDLSGSSIEVGGDLQVEGDLIVDNASVSGQLQARSISVQGLEATGGVSAATIVGRESLSLGGDIRADRIDGGDLRIDEGDVNVRILAATRSVHLGAITIKSDIVMAPTVTMDASAGGRISVLESGTEPGTSRVKGCLSLEDLEELFGNSQQFLAERGLEDPGYGPRTASATPPPPARASTRKSKAAAAPPPPAPEPQREVEVEVEVEDPGDSMLASIGPIAAEVHAAIEAEDDRTLDEMLDHEPDSPTNGIDHGSALDSLIELSNVSEIDAIEEGSASVRVSSSPGPSIQVQAEGEYDLFGWADQMLTEVVAPDAVKDLDMEIDIDVEVPTGSVEPILEPEPEPEPEPELVPEPAEDPIHGQIQETVGKIVTCYLHTEMPPAVSRLKDLVEARDYGRVRSDITEIWNQLLKFHQKRGMRIQPQVTTTFNTINSLVRKL